MTEACNCERKIEATGFRLIRMDCKDGEQVDCPDCGKTYVHVCDEAEGCFWAPREESGG